VELAGVDRGGLAREVVDDLRIAERVHAGPDRGLLGCDVASGVPRPTMDGMRVPAQAAASDSRWRGLLARLGGLGGVPDDPPELRARNTLLVAVSLMVLPAGVAWGTLYWVFGEPIAALFPGDTCGS
jgi:hypothetical protein